MPTELRDTDDARRYLAQAVCLLRTARPVGRLQSNEPGVRRDLCGIGEEDGFC